jgi:hypothetical protein
MENIMINKRSTRTAYITSLLIGSTFYGWFGPLSATNAGTELSTSTLSGYAYVDLDIDGFLDPSETGLANVEIVLTKLSDPHFSIAKLSNQSGYYEFNGLHADIYTITQPTLPMGAWNAYVREGELRDRVTDILLSSNAGTAVLLDQSQAILPHVEGIELIDGAQGTDYNFGQVYLGKAWLTTDPPPIIPAGGGGGVPEPTTGLLLAISGMLLGFTGRHRGRR